MPRISTKKKQTDGLTHEIYDKLLGLEILLHLHPYAVHLEFLEHFLLLLWLVVIPKCFDNLLLGELVPLELLHLRAGRYGHFFASGQEII